MGATIPSSPTQKCLQVDEVLRLIARELVASGGQSSAVALACCCRNFEDPALDALWETQHGYTSLLATLPKDVWKSEDHSFNRLPTIHEWAHLYKYARRVRTLEVEEACIPSPQVFRILQLRNLGRPLFPNLRALDWWPSSNDLIDFIPMFLSPSTIEISLDLVEISDLPLLASSITILPQLCPNLQILRLHSLPRDPIIVAATSELILQITNGDAVRTLCVDSPLTKEAYQAISESTKLQELYLVIEGGASPSPLKLPNLRSLTVKHDNGDGWLGLFRGATFGELESITFCRSEMIVDPLERFRVAALTTSIPSTLSKLSFPLTVTVAWSSNYRSLLPFVQMRELDICFVCWNGCLSTIDDSTITDLARSMPGLEILYLGALPCSASTVGVTVKGLSVLAHHCPRLSRLRIHFGVESLGPQGIPPIADDGPAIPRNACPLRYLGVGSIPVPEESMLVVALTLVRIFPHLEEVGSLDERWRKIASAVATSKKLTGHSRRMDTL